MSVMGSLEEVKGHEKSGGRLPVSRLVRGSVSLRRRWRRRASSSESLRDLMVRGGEPLSATYRSAGATRGYFRETLGGYDVRSQPNPSWLFGGMSPSTARAAACRPRPRTSVTMITGRFGTATSGASGITSGAGMTGSSTDGSIGTALSASTADAPALRPSPAPAAPPVRPRGARWFGALHGAARAAKGASGNFSSRWSRSPAP